MQKPGLRKMLPFVMPETKLTDSDVRLLKDGDIDDVINLLRLNYGNDYINSRLYDPEYYKRTIYDDHTIYLVIEDEKRVVASGVLTLDYGDYDDQIGLLGGLVVHPERKGRGLAKRMVNTLIGAARETVVFAYCEARTANTFAQQMFERASFQPLGFMPLAYTLGDRFEGVLPYGNLFGQGRELRRSSPPRVIPEVAALARHSLAAMRLPATLDVIENSESYPRGDIDSLKSLEQHPDASLIRIEHATEPLMFGSLSLDQGTSFVRRHDASYEVAFDLNGQALGAVGYRFDQPNRRVKGIELIADNDAMRGRLCFEFVELAQTGLKARVIEVDVSAYDAAIQRTFHDLGFHPVAYAPAMVFHKGERLDVVRMMKLDAPYVALDIPLTEPAKGVVSIVEASFTRGNK